MLTKFFYSTMKGAPVLASEWGSLLDVLKACLLNGFNSQAVVSASLSGETHTLTLAAGHGFIQHQVIKLSGSEQAEANTEHRVSSVTSTTVSFEMTLATVLTGMMTIKTAPMGWTEEFSDTNKSVFTAKDKIKNPFWLRVDNSLPAGYDTSWAKFARVTIAEKMVGIDDFGSYAKAPTSPAHPNTNEQGNGVTGASGIYGWAKWYHGIQTNPDLNETGIGGRSSSFEWEIVGDDTRLYLLAKITDQQGRAVYTFAPVITANSTDRFNCFLSATNGLRAANANGGWYVNGRNSSDSSWASLSTDGKFLLRDYTGAGNTHANCGLFSLNTGNNQQVSGRSEDLPFPNKPDNSVVLHDVYVKESGAGIRGTLPLVKWIHNRWAFPNKTVLDKQQGKYLILGADYKNEGMTSFFAFELEG